MSNNPQSNWLPLLDDEPMFLDDDGDWCHSWFDSRLKRVFNSGVDWSGREGFIEVFNTYNPDVSLHLYTICNDGDEPLNRIEQLNLIDPAIAHLALTSNQRLVEVESFSYEILFWYITLRSTTLTLQSFTLTDLLIGESNGQF